MSIKGRDFFKQAPAHRDPVIPRCDGFDCFERANPAWRDGSRTYCRNCAPDNLKRPSSQEYRDVEETRSR